MKRMYTIMAVCLLVISAFGWDYYDDVVSITGTTNTATAVTQTMTKVRGEIEAIHIILGTATNVDIDIVVNPGDSTEDSFTLYSADDIDSDRIISPRFDAHTSGGAANTNDPPEPYVCMGDPIECVISDWAVTGKTAKIKIVFKK